MDSGSVSLPLSDYFNIPTLVIGYFPLKRPEHWFTKLARFFEGEKHPPKPFSEEKARLDINVTGDVDASLKQIRHHVKRTTKQVIRALEQGSTYHGYKNRSAKPCLRYQIVDEIEFLEPLPTLEQPGFDAPLTDYVSIMERVDIRSWVEERGVKEVWIWGYHGNKVVLWESNMAGPFGDISNSNRDPHDLPVLDKTYTVYHYNYQRGPSEAVEDHIHQIEHVLNYVDGRDVTLPQQWSELLFWGRFVGSDHTHKIVNPGCGWAHYPPNAERDYDWANRRYVWTDIEDWRPDGSGQKKRINCERWHCNSLDWFIYWMQNLPGPNNGLAYWGRPLTNWWVFIGNFDGAMEHGLKLVR